MRALAEYVVLFLAVVANEIGHVFDDAQDWDVDFFEHQDPAGDVDERERVRGGDDDGAVEGGLLDEGELDVAGTGWHIDQEVV